MAREGNPPPSPKKKKLSRHEIFAPNRGPSPEKPYSKPYNSSRTTDTNNRHQQPTRTSGKQPPSSLLIRQTSFIPPPSAILLGQTTRRFGFSQPDKPKNLSLHNSPCVKGRPRKRAALPYFVPGQKTRSIGYRGAQEGVLALSLARWRVDFKRRNMRKECTGDVWGKQSACGPSQLASQLKEDTRDEKRGFSRTRERNSVKKGL